MKKFSIDNKLKLKKEINNTKIKQISMEKDKITSKNKEIEINENKNENEKHEDINKEDDNNENQEDIDKEDNNNENHEIINEENISNSKNDKDNNKKDEENINYDEEYESEFEEYDEEETVYDNAIKENEMDNDMDNSSIIDENPHDNIESNNNDNDNDNDNMKSKFENQSSSIMKDSKITLADADDPNDIDENNKNNNIMEENNINEIDKKTNVTFVKDSKEKINEVNKNKNENENENENENDNDKKNNNDNNDNNNNNNGINLTSLPTDIKNKDSRVNYLMIVNSISRDNDFFKKNHHFLEKPTEDNEECSKTSYDLFKSMLTAVKEFAEQKKWINFFLITIAQRIYINRVFILDVINDPEKTKKYPIAKSIAIASKSADDISICLMLLIEAAGKKNNLPLRFSYGKAWAFYQCCVIYILRFIATQEMKYLKENDSKQSSKYSIFSSFPQETLAPCYFYLELLKNMRLYFVNAQSYIREVKLLIYEAEKSVREKTFHVEINDIFQ